MVGPLGKLGLASNTDRVNAGSYLTALLVVSLGMTTLAGRGGSFLVTTGALGLIETKLAGSFFLEADFGTGGGAGTAGLAAGTTAGFTGATGLAEATGFPAGFTAAFTGALTTGFAAGLTAGLEGAFATGLTAFFGAGFGAGFLTTGLALGAGFLEAGFGLALATGFLAVGLALGAGFLATGFALGAGFAVFFGAGFFLMAIY